MQAARLVRWPLFATLLSTVLTAGVAEAQEHVFGFNEPFPEETINTSDTTPSIYDNAFHLSVHYQRAGVTWSDSVAREGEGSLRFELDAYDTPADAERPYNYRCEIAMHPWHDESEGPGTEKWFGVSLFVPPDWVADSVIESVLQIHAGEATPPFIMMVEGDEILFRNKYGSCGSDSHEVDTHTLVPAITKGTWYDFVIQIIAADSTNADDGELRIWVDGNLTAEWLGQNLFDCAPYIGALKLGVYKWEWKDEESVNESAASSATNRVYHYDMLRTYVGSNGYDLVDPSVPEDPNAPQPDAGVQADGGDQVDASPPADAGTEDAAGTVDAATDTGNETDGAPSGSAQASEEDSGCSCGVVSTPARPHAAWLLALFGILAWRRRRSP